MVGHPDLEFVLATTSDDVAGFLAKIGDTMVGVLI